ncbi:TetR/AcrR family transcriptional regulator [Sciscionella sediminilitoris]|uniref:TetR/AcrR family transcriptional regulator n=1 Tax=Sciscionella sediminilitoris TaxID=1445613 RepID=UPI0012E24170|nr:TetR/AcrR family transcriptional regulator [Sciscionella sp. SE31]
MAEEEMTSGATVLADALLDEVVHTHDPVAVRILDAATESYMEHGIRRTSMDDVARRAGVGRATVYRKFAGRDKLTVAVIARDAQRFFAEIGRATESIADVGERLVEGLVIGLRWIREQPLLHRLLHTEPELVLPAVTLHAGPALATIREFLAAQYRASEPPALRVPIDPDEVAEIVVRLAVSLTLTPETVLPLNSEEQIRATARRYLSFVLPAR